jgi:hypothetical protein
MQVKPNRHPKMIEKELLLTARRNLPEHLRVLAEKYPATSWQPHPNFSELASFWLERHSMFRELMLPQESQLL